MSNEYLMSEATSVRIWLQMGPLLFDDIVPAGRSFLAFMV